MSMRFKIAAAAAFLLVTGGVAYAQSTMPCCEDCECCEEMMAARERSADAEPSAEHSQHDGM